MIVDKLKDYHVPSSKVILQSFDFESINKLAQMNVPYELGVLISKKNIGINHLILKQLQKLLTILILITALLINILWKSTC